MKGVFSSLVVLSSFTGALSGETSEDFTVREVEPLVEKGRNIPFVPFFTQPGQIKFSFKNGIRHGHVQDPALVWDWGFRNGFGWNTVSGNWNVSTAYTRFYSKSFAGLEAGEGFVMPVWKAAEVNKEAALQQKEWIAWRLHLDLADVEIGKSMEISSKVLLRPHAGIRGAWIYQKRRRVKSRWKDLPQEGSAAPVFCSNTCAGLGGRIGMDSFWNAAPGWDFFVDGAFSVLAGYYNIDQKSPSLGSPSSLAPGIAVTEFSVGMQYERSFFTRQFVSFRVGYEWNYLFNRTGWLDRMGNSDTSGIRPESGMSLQGVTLGLRWFF